MKVLTIISAVIFATFVVANPVKEGENGLYHQLEKKEVRKQGLEFILNKFKNTGLIEMKCG
jgi:hypothetical protein